MSRDPTSSELSDGRHSQPPSVPTLGRTCRLIREQRGISRDTAAARLKVSRSYLADIERDRRTPTEEFLEHIIIGYQLDATLARHLRELRTAAIDLEPTVVLHKAVTANSALMAHLHERRDLAAYIDPAWTVLACNDAFRHAGPGLGPGVSIPVWTFSDDAKRQLPNWSYEADHMVGLIRGFVGRYRGSEQVQSIFRHLRPVTEFRTRWNDGVHPAYGRDPSELAKIHHPVTGSTASYSITITHQSEDVILFALSEHCTKAADSPDTE